MADLQERLRAAEDIPAPDLWGEIETRTPKAIPNAPRRRAPAMIAALAVAAAGITTLVLVFGPAGPTPVGAPRGAQIAFVRTDCVGLCREPSETWVMNADGSEARRLVQGAQPAWSPDGTMIAYVRDPGRLYVASADGSNPRPIASCEGPCESDLYPTWSPDGSRIAFIRQGRIGPAPQRPTSDLYLVPLAGSAPRSLDVCRMPRCSSDWIPAWSPDGRTIAFGSVVPSSETKRPFVEVVRLLDVESGSLRTLVRGGSQGLSWSPDSNSLVITKNAGLVVINREATRLQRITGCDGCDDSDPAWSPDGRWIAFTRTTNAGRTSRIYLVHPDGSDLHAIYGGGSIGAFWATWRPAP